MRTVRTTVPTLDGRVMAVSRAGVEVWAGVLDASAGGAFEGGAADPGAAAIGADVGGDLGFFDGDHGFAADRAEGHGVSFARGCEDMRGESTTEGKWNEAFAKGVWGSGQVGDAAED